MPSDVSEREQKVLNIIETARAKRSKFRDSQITMAHGAGGKATQSLRASFGIFFDNWAGVSATEPSLTACDHRNRRRSSRLANRSQHSTFSRSPRRPRKDEQRSAAAPVAPERPHSATPHSR